MKLVHCLERLWKAPPRAYIPGATLAKVAQDLTGLRRQAVTAMCWRFDQPGACWNFMVSEQVQAQFLIHIVSSRFVMSVANSEAGKARICLTHSGLWRRTGLNWKIKQGNHTHLPALLARLDADQPLYQALMALDFHYFALIQDDNGWRVEAEPYGASEVVVRFPAMRRYIRLSFEQAQGLFNAFSRLQGKLRMP